MSFAAALGLALVSPSPTWRDTSIALTALTGLWLLLVAFGSFGFGGYIAGRVRSTWSTKPEEVEFRDGLHGLLVWALAVLLGAVLSWMTALSYVTLGSPIVQRPPQGEPAFLAYEVDRLFRSDRRPDTPDAGLRAEAGRLLMAGAGRRELTGDERAYLTRLVAARTGLEAQEANRRAEEVLNETRQAARRARATSVIIGFMTAASLALGAAAAWFAAGVGGRHRDQAISPPLRWTWRRPAA
jgi:hypothetical protein